MRVYSSPKPTQPERSKSGVANSRPQNLSASGEGPGARRGAVRSGFTVAMAGIIAHRTQAAGVPPCSKSTSGARLYSEALFVPGDALLFGPETRGLPPGVLEQLPRERQLTIPMRAGNRSLNLSNAVALVVYEAWRQTGFAVAPGQ